MTELTSSWGMDRYMYLLLELYFMSSTRSVIFILSINDASIKSNDKKLQRENNKINVVNSNRCFTTSLF